MVDGEGATEITGTGVLSELGVAETGAVGTGECIGRDVNQDVSDLSFEKLGPDECVRQTV